MSDEFFSSVETVREVSIDMLKNIRAVKGENYARLVHSMILADQIDHIFDVFRESAADGSSAQLANFLTDHGSKMTSRIMQYYIRSTGFSDEQVKEAFKDADLLQKNSMQLLQTASKLAEDGKTMGDE